MAFEPTSVEVTSATLPKEHCVQVSWNIHQSMWIHVQVTGLKTLTSQKVNESTLAWVTCVTLPNNCVQVLRKSIKVWRYNDHLKTLTARSMTPNNPLETLTPHLLGSPVLLYPSIIVLLSSMESLPKDQCLKSHGNTSKYVDTVTIFQNLNPK